MTVTGKHYQEMHDSQTDGFSASRIIDTVCICTRVTVASYV